MKTLKTLLFLVMLGLALPSAVSAETFEHEAAKVTFESPDSWQADKDDDILTIAPKDGSVALVFMMLDAGDLDAAGDALDEELAKQFTNIKPQGEPEMVKINGMQAVSMEAKAKMEGSPIELGVLILETKSGKILLILGMGDPSGMKKHEASLGKILMSIKSK